MGANETHTNLPHTLQLLKDGTVLISDLNYVITNTQALFAFE